MLGSCCDILGNKCLGITVTSNRCVEKWLDSRYISTVRTTGSDDGLDLGQIKKKTQKTLKVFWSKQLEEWSFHLLS